MPLITFAQAIRDALAVAMTRDPGVICFGLGVDDPRGVFGTTLNLHKEFGAERAFDIPTAESSLTGIGVGAALNGLRPVMSHQRLDFALLSMDQLVNNAAKWHFMFGGQLAVPLTVRMIIGRGWGQGPTHSQSLQSWFAHIPGLKVVMPSSAADAKGLLLSSIFDDNPVVYLEHRWLHNLKGEVPAGDYRVPIGKARVVREGKDVTVVAMSYMTVEAIHAVDHLEAQGISCELIDLRTIRPLDWPAIALSVRKTGRLLVLDSGFATGGVGGEIVARMAMDCWSDLKCAPRRLAAPDVSEASSPALTKDYHVRAEHIAARAGEMLGMTPEVESLRVRRTHPHDVPGDWFAGPF
jgi:acetoin:2,6-dichlorophenolindophenol oxidoreductase subunit beta